MPMLFDNLALLHLVSFVFPAAIVKPSRRDAGAPRAERIDTAKQIHQYK
jgi:hypothetical protein